MKKFYRQAKMAFAGKCNRLFYKYRNAFKTLIFSACFLILFALFSFLLQPIWIGWNNYSTFSGFYDEPRDTIETVFLGPSFAVTGYTPMELYDQYGICAYNLGSEQQSMLVSYYWLLESYRYHAKSMKTVVLQSSELFRSPDIALYRKGIDLMRPSTLKLRAVKDYSEHKGEEGDSFYYDFPLLAYHDRWSSLERDDFLKSNYPIEEYTRGYCFSMNLHMNSQSYASMRMPYNVLDEDAEPAELDSEAFDYLQKIIAFCKEKGLNLVLMTTPAAGSVSQHKAISSIAEENELDYLDFNCSPFFEEMEFNYAVDSMDGGHLNYYGASKTTKWIGDYLVEKCGATDVRGNPRYAFMDEELEQYQREVLDVVSLKEEREFCDYLKLASQNNDYAVFLSVKDEGSGALQGDGVKKALSDMGFKTLLTLGSRESYLALIEEGKIVFEATNGKRNVARIGRLKNRQLYNMNSGGMESIAVEGDETQKGMIASCFIDGAE